MGKLEASARKVWRQMQRVFHFLVGVAFLALAAIGISVSLDAWRMHSTHPATSLLRFYLLAGFTIFLIFFCLFSFLKARSVR
ncbi:MAG: hypothetical protein ACRD3D_13565 [Terriglobia bacterium]